MKKNMGSLDKIIRSLIAAAFVTLYLADIITGVWGIVLVVIATVFLFTSFISFCPLYTVFGISSMKKNK